MEQVQHWCAGWNRAGYGVESPESVLHGGTIAEAFDHVQAELEAERDTAASFGSDAQKFTDAIDALTQMDQREVEVQARLSKVTGGYVSVTVNGWEYWVQACYTVGCDQVETEEDD